MTKQTEPAAVDEHGQLQADGLYLYTDIHGIPLEEVEQAAFQEWIDEYDLYFIDSYLLDEVKRLIENDFVTYDPTYETLARHEFEYPPHRSRDEFESLIPDDAATRDDTK